jgi:hypothetical protein
MLETKTKRCSKCKQEKDLDDFSNNRTKSGGKEGTCKECCSASHKLWREKNKEHIKQKGKERYEANKEEMKAQMRQYRKDNPKKMRDLHYRRYYGINIHDYNEMLYKQQNCCGICGCFAGEERLCVDHDHETGEVRGLLCQLCNKALGLFKDDKGSLERAIAYLERYE